MGAEYEITGSPYEPTVVAPIIYLYAESECETVNALVQLHHSAKDFGGIPIKSFYFGHAFGYAQNKNAPEGASLLVLWRKRRHKNNSAQVTDALNTPYQLTIVDVY